MIIVPSNVGKANPYYRFNRQTGPSDKPVIVGSTAYWTDTPWAYIRWYTLNPTTGKSTLKFSGGVNNGQYGMWSPRVMNNNIYYLTWGANYYGTHIAKYDTVANTYSSTQVIAGTYGTYQKFTLSDDGLVGFCGGNGDGYHLLKVNFSSAGGSISGTTFIGTGSGTTGNGTTNGLFQVGQNKVYTGAGVVASESNKVCLAVYSGVTNAFVKYIQPLAGTSFNGWIMTDIGNNKMVASAYNTTTYDNGLLVFDTSTDTAIDYINTGAPYYTNREPVKIGNKLWFCITDYDAGTGKYNPRLWSLDLTTYEKIAYPSDALSYVSGGGSLTYDLSNDILYMAQDSLAVCTLNAVPSNDATSLVHFEGTDDATLTRMAEVVDYAPDGGGWRIQATPHYTSSQYKFGTSSMDSSTGCIYTYDKYPMWGSNVFTSECWIRPTGTSSTTGNIITFRPNDGGYGPFSLYQNGSTLNLICGNAALNAWTTLSGGTLSANTWYHVAVCSNGTTLKVFLNGNEIISTTQPAWNSNARMPMWVGGYLTYYFQGHVDEFRMSYGKARYTSNFTPPTAPFV